MLAMLVQNNPKHFYGEGSVKIRKTRSGSHRIHEDRLPYFCGSTLTINEKTQVLWANHTDPDPSDGEGYDHFLGPVWREIRRLCNDTVKLTSFCTGIYIATKKETQKMKIIENPFEFEQVLLCSFFSFLAMRQWKKKCTLSNSKWIRLNHLDIAILILYICFEELI